LETVEHYH